MMPCATLPTLLAVLLTTSAPAQPRRVVPFNQSIGAGVQWELSRGARMLPGLQVSWRRWFSLHLGIGTDFRFGRDDQSDRMISSSALGVGLLARGLIGRVSLIAGAGPGFFIDRTTSARPVPGGRDAQTTTRRFFGLQMLMEADVRLTSRLSAFAGVRMEQPILSEFESSSGYPTAGVRFAF